MLNSKDDVKYIIDSRWKMYKIWIKYEKGLRQTVLTGGDFKEEEEQTCKLGRKQ